MHKEFSALHKELSRNAMLIIRVEIRSQMNERCVYNVSHHAIGSGKWIQQDLNCT
jgi:hypothetical protein